MTVWLARAGKYGEDEATALEKEMAIIWWGDMPDVSKVNHYGDEVIKVLSTN